ncbi:MAG: outer membrane beta-barrel protein [Polyangiales bacterium]
MRFVMPFLCGALALAPSVVQAQTTARRRRPAATPTATTAAVTPAAAPAATPAATTPAVTPSEPTSATPAATATPPAQTATTAATTQAAATAQTGATEAQATTPSASGDAATTATPAEPAAPASGGDAATPAAGGESSEAEPAVHFHGTLEAAYSYNFNEPSNGVTAWRWYDNRHNMIGLQNALLTTEWNLGPVKGHVALQLGAFTELFWEGRPGAPSDLLWRFMQEATTEWTTPYERLSIEGGLYNVPFGPEYNTAYQNWNWSTSNLFALMPYQIAGFRANFDIGHGWTARAGVYNGWDQIVSDNNSSKSVMVSLEWENPDDEDTYFFFNYMVGNERDREDERGPYARHTFDVYGQWHATEHLYLRGHIFSGLEPTRGSTIDGWFGAALFAKYDVLSWFSVAARGDMVRTFSGSTGQNLFHADNLDDPTRSTLLGSATLTLDVHPVSHVSVRLEARHDRADFPLFFSGDVPRLPMDAGDQATESSQTTVTAGLTTWF